MVEYLFRRNGFEMTFRKIVWEDFLMFIIYERKNWKLTCISEIMQVPKDFTVALIMVFKWRFTIGGRNNVSTRTGYVLEKRFVVFQREKWQEIYFWYDLIVRFQLLCVIWCQSLCWWGLTSFKDVKQKLAVLISIERNIDGRRLKLKFVLSKQCYATPRPRTLHFSDHRWGYRASA